MGVVPGKPSRPLARDGGATGRNVKTVACELDFVNEQEGWVIARQPHQQTNPETPRLADIFREAILLHTLDGGQTWQEIKPVAAE